MEVEGCIRRGVSREIAEKIFAEMESFASYAFNKSHATAYAWVSYQTAYMKYHYPKEFMAALLTACWTTPTRWRATLRNALIWAFRFCRLT